MKLKVKHFIILGLVIPLTIFGMQAQTTQAVDKVTLNGSGSTFVQPLIADWAADFYDNATSQLVQINYAGGGSGRGLSDIESVAVDFAGSDAPMFPADTAKANGTILTIPETMGAIVITYNMPSITTPLVFNGSVLAQIFQANITKWNDPAIAQLNSGVTLPDTDIIVAHRSDASGTTFAFSDYLDRASPNWILGTSKTIQWPANSQGGSGNPGVAAIVKSTENSIGYVELGYTLKDPTLKVANIKNKSGQVVAPTAAGVAASAASAAPNLPAGDGDWSSVSIADQSGDAVYPICTFTYIMVYKDLTASKTNYGAKGAAIVAWLHFMLSDEAQAKSEGLGYAPLPSAALNKSIDSVNSIVYQGSWNDYWNPNPAAPGFEMGILLLGLLFVSIIVRKRKNY